MERSRIRDGEKSDPGKTSGSAKMQWNQNKVNFFVPCVGDPHKFNDDPERFRIQLLSQRMIRFHFPKILRIRIRTPAWQYIYYNSWLLLYFFQKKNTGRGFISGLPQTWQITPWLVCKISSRLKFKSRGTMTKTVHVESLECSTYNIQYIQQGCKVH